jgi:hypothetical protein
MASRLDWKVEAINKLNNNQIIGAAFLPRFFFAMGGMLSSPQAG